MDKTLSFSTLMCEYFILTYEAFSLSPAQAQENCNINADPLPAGCEIYIADSKKDDRTQTRCEVGPIPKSIEGCHRVIKCANDRDVNHGYDTCFYYGYEPNGTRVPALGAETLTNAFCTNGILIVAPNSLFGMHSNRDECSAY